MLLYVLSMYFPSLRCVLLPLFFLFLSNKKAYVGAPLSVRNLPSCTLALVFSLLIFAGSSKMMMVGGGDGDRWRRGKRVKGSGGSHETETLPSHVYLPSAFIRPFSYLRSE